MSEPEKDIVDELRLRAQYLREGSCYARAADALEAKDARIEFLDAQWTAAQIARHEARATIEAQAAEIGRLKDKAENLNLAAASFKMLHDEARAEIERLREALKEIKLLDRFADPGEPWQYGNYAAIAQRALTSGGKE